MRGHVYVMSVPGEPVLCKVGRTNRSIRERFGRNMQYGGRTLSFYGWHPFEDVDVAEREVHSLLASCRAGRDEFFQIEPSGAWGALLWYAGEVVLRPTQPRRELRLWRTREAERIAEQRWSSALYRAAA